MSDQTLRPLFPMELFSSSRHHLGIYRCVTVACRYTSPGPLDATTLYPALKAVIASEPMLQVCIVGEETNAPKFKHVPELDLSHHVAFSTIDSDYESELAARQGFHLDQTWTELSSRPPWRIEVLNGNDVVFAFHHALLDGTSALIFHEKLLAGLNSNTAGDSSPMLKLETPGLPAPQEQDVAFSSSFPFMVRTVWKELGPGKMFSATPKYWSAKSINFALPYKTQVALFDFPADTVSKLLAACRAHGTSITGLLHALTLASCAKRLSATDAPSFMGATAISLRPFLKPSANDAHRQMLRTLVLAMDHLFSEKQVSRFRGDGDLNALVWEAAKQVKDEINKKVATLPRDDVTGLMHFVKDWFAFWRKKDGMKRNGSWNLSNIGVLKPSTGDYGISRIIFTNGAPVVGAPLALSAASVAGGALTLSVSWQDQVVEDAFVVDLVEDMNSYIGGFVKSGTF